MNIGFIGFGEAAYCISKGLQNHNQVKIVAFDSMESSPLLGQNIRARAKETGVTLLPDAKEVAKVVDILIASVPSSHTLDVCRETAEFLRAGQIYADVSASTPATKEIIWSILEPKGALFVDAAMLGSLPLDKHRVPITASGNGAQAFYELMTPLGMRITLAGDRPGAASAIKLIRSVFMKGLAACMYEMLQGADAYDVSEEVIASTAKSLDGIPFIDHLNRLVTSTSLHAFRRAAELKGSIKMLEESSLDASMSVAAMHKHELISQYHFDDSKPKSWIDVIEKMRTTKFVEEHACL